MIFQNAEHHINKLKCSARMVNDRKITLEIKLVNCTIDYFSPFHSLSFLLSSATTINIDLVGIVSKMSKQYSKVIAFHVSPVLIFYW